LNTSVEHQHLSIILCPLPLTFRDPGSVEIFFSAHGVPKSYVEEAGDPYKEEMEVSK
jgi:protoheme ferro-lyase